MNKIKTYMILLLILIVLCICFIGKYTYNTIQAKKEGWIPVSEVDISDVPEDVIGYLSIPSLNSDYYINMPIKDGVELNIMATSIGHFTETPYTNGNVCLVAHNSGTNKSGQYVGYFDSIKNLVEGDKIVYNNLDTNYVYEVISNKIIAETDISVLDNTEDNRLTLITCVKGSSNRTYRQCIIAKMICSDYLQDKEEEEL